MYSPKEIFNRFVVTAIVNTVIAVLLWGLTSHTHFGRMMIASQSIGLSCALVVTVTQAVFFGKERKLPHFVMLGVVTIGVVLGIWVSWLFGVPVEGDSLHSSFGNLWSYLFISVLMSLGFHFYYSSRARLKSLEQARAEAELREANVQKAALGARLRALQAQIEPHFLFNTLANLHSLIGRDDEAARRLLERINDYLRATLVHSRAERATLGDECRMLGAYLDIQAQRMGGRLTWQIDVGDDLRVLPFPPMLLQPLVENAVVHGIEPKLGEGRIVLAAQKRETLLELSVTDNGQGFGETGSSGVGLANIRERLNALFDGQAWLEIRENSPSGVIARLWIPLDAPAH